MWTRGSSSGHVCHDRTLSLLPAGIASDSIKDTVLDMY